MKIGFIAMSGVRAHHEALNAFGLTLPGFVERSKVIATLPSLSLLTLAALTPPCHEVEYLEIADIRTKPELPRDFDLVAITSYSAQVYDAYTVADGYRAAGVPVVMGGLHVSVLPDEALAHCTTVVVGEGEPVWPRLLADAARGQMRRMYSHEPYGAYDLADSPTPRYDLLDPSRYNRLTVQTSRGCPHKCDFCASSILLTRGYKLKPVDKVIGEVRAIKRIWDRPFIEFADDNSFIHRAHYKDLLRALTTMDVRWFTETDVAVARDDALLALMRDSGCKQVLIGFESPNRRALDGIELRANWKMKQADGYLRAIEKIQSYGITVDGCFILGLDGDTPDVFEDVYQFVMRSELYDVQITYPTPFPGTQLYERLKAEGRLLRDRAWELCTLFDINFVPKNMTIKELEQGSLALAKLLYSEEETTARHGLFRDKLRRAKRDRRAERSHLEARDGVATHQPTL